MKTLRLAVGACRKFMLYPAIVWPRLLWDAIWPTMVSLRIEWVSLVPLLIGATAAASVFDALPYPRLWVWLLGDPKQAILEQPQAVWLMSQWRAAGLGGFEACLQRAALCVCLYPVVAFSVMVTLWGPALFLSFDARAPRASLRTTHGSARWGTAADLRRRNKRDGIKANAGVKLGDLNGLELRTERHVILASPSGGGKGIFEIIANLLTFKGGIFCVDPKGENYFVTHNARVAMGCPVARIDPFGILAQHNPSARSHAFNWLDTIDIDDESCIRKATRLAESLILRNSSKDAHWDNSAASLLGGLILLVASRQDKNRRHMGEVRALLMQSKENWEKTIAIMRESPMANQVISRRGASLLGKSPNEAASIISSAEANTAFLDDPAVVRTLLRSDFSMSQLRSEALAVYLVIPPSYIDVYSGYIRAFLGLVLETLEEQATQNLPHKVLMMVDEFGQLGRFDALERAISIVRGMKMQVMLVLQGLSQGASLYPKWPAMMSSAALVTLGINDNATAEYISQALGKYTVEERTTSKASTMLFGPSRHTRSTSYHGRDLLSVDELRCLAADRAIVLEKSTRPFLLRVRPYFKDRALRRVASANPFVPGDTVGKAGRARAAGAHVMRWLGGWLKAKASTLDGA